jgi:acyl-CoA oxidase
VTFSPQTHFWTFKLTELCSISYILAAGNHVRRLYAKPQKKKEDWKQIHVLSAGIKAVSTWHKAEALQLARECVGGQGFAMVNRIAQLRAGTEIDLTLEGDNTVLLQQVSRQLLKKNGSEYWMRQAANNSAASAGAVITGCGIKAMDNRPFLQAIFEWRVHLLLKLAKDRPEDTTTAASLSSAFVDMISLHELFRIIDALASNSQERQSLEIMARLFVAFKLERDLGFIVSWGGLSRDQAKRVLRWVNDLCDAIHPSVLALLDVPPVPDTVVRAPIAFNYVERHHYGRDLSRM